MIVFCTTCRNRAAHLARTLPANLAANPKSTFVVIDYGSNDELPEVIAANRCERLKVWRFEADKFRMAHAKNMAHRLGILEGADILVNVDADNFLLPGYEDFVMQAVGPNSFLWAGHVRGKGRKYRGVSGRIAMPVGAFLKTGGYDEDRFNAWGHDDTDLTARLTLLKYNGIETPLCYLECIPHGDGLRFRDYPEVQPIEPDAYDEPPPLQQGGIVNYGEFGCGWVRRYDGSFEYKIAPLPTRIFGIGLHKTATTSLHGALQMLGYESAHWPTGAWARDVWEEMNAKGYSPTLEQYYAISDLPMPLLYRELDHAYPGSKFILTIRDEVDWLRSVRDHFSHKNAFHYEWDIYPITNRLHKVIYGRTGFDAKVFLQTYRRHNLEVIRYFKNRPNDLLVMQEHNWADLCHFLNKPVPTTPYPRMYVTPR